MTDIIQTLVEMRNGEAAMDCNRKFNELLSAVFETGKKGKVVVTLEVQPSKFAMGGGVVEVEIEHNCSIKKPELEVGHTLFFVAPDGSLTRDDPSQLSFLSEKKEIPQND